MIKTIKITLIFLLCLPYLGISQNLTEENLLRYSELDTNNITTGILYDKSIPFSKIERFDGENLDFVCSQALWQQMYFELQYAKNTPDTSWANSLDFIFGRKNEFTSGKLIPIYLLNFDYNKIKENAFDDGLLFLKDDKILENSNKNISPYTTNKAFAATPYKETTYYGNDFSFIFNNNFLYSNTNEEIIEIWADFDDYLGLRQVNKYEKIPISYSEIGAKIITIKAITENQDTLSTKFEFNVKDFDIPHYDLIRFQTDETTGTTRWFCPLDYTYYNTLAGALLNSPCRFTLLEEHICHSGGDLYHFKSTVTPDVPERILLVVEGFDVSDNMFAEELYGDVFNRQKFADCALENNYDIFILNFDLPTDDIELNAILVENVIDYLNEIKPNKTELIVAGGSMGGLVTRYALTTMEQKGKDTQTRLWFSFDSPQGGGNIPLGLQYWLDELSSSFTLPPLSYRLDRLCDPAAKQMLIYHFLDYPNTAPERISFIQDIDNLGYPVTCRNVAITNGASDGTNQGYSDGSEIMQITWKMPARRRRYLNAWAVPDGGNNFTVCKKVKVKDNGTQIILEEYKATDTYPLDAAPGGFRETMIELEIALGFLFDVEALHWEHTFIPALSSLDINPNSVPNGYYYDFYAEEPNVLLNITPFDNVFFPNYPVQNINQEHVWVSFETANNILDEVMPTNLVMGDDPDWQTGEIVAENSIHLTHGFHGSADEQIHLHIDHINRNLIPEQWSSDYDDKSVKSSKNNDKNINIESNITIYPNPTNGIFTINSQQQIGNIIITDISGKIFYLKNNISNNYLKINISDVEQGIYLLKITTENNISTQKIIKL